MSCFIVGYQPEASVLNRSKSRMMRRLAVPERQMCALKAAHDPDDGFGRRSDHIRHVLPWSIAWESESLALLDSVPAREVSQSAASRWSARSNASILFFHASCSLLPRYLMTSIAASGFRFSMLK